MERGIAFGDPWEGGISYADPLGEGLKQKQVLALSRLGIFHLSALANKFDTLPNEKCSPIGEHLFLFAESWRRLSD